MMLTNWTTEIWRCIPVIRIAIVGTGNISHAHVKGYLEFPDRCKIVALVDIVPEKAQRMKETYQLDADVYDDHE